MAAAKMAFEEDIRMSRKRYASDYGDVAG